MYYVFRFYDRKARAATEYDFGVSKSYRVGVPTNDNDKHKMVDMARKSNKCSLHIKKFESPQFIMFYEGIN